MRNFIKKSIINKIVFFTVALVCLICTSCFLYEEKVIVAEAEEIMTRTIVDSSDLVNVVTEARITWHS